MSIPPREYKLHECRDLIYLASCHTSWFDSPSEMSTWHIDTEMVFVNCINEHSCLIVNQRICYCKVRLYATPWTIAH